MAEYIEREALQAALVRKRCGVANQRYTEGWNDCLLRVKSMVSKTPSADVAPVVRCENCRYAMWVEWAKKYSCGQVRGLLVFGDHFCAFGKREYESRPQASL